MRNLHVFVRRFLGFDVRLLAFRDPKRILVLRRDSVRYRGQRRDRNVLFAQRGRFGVHLGPGNLLCWASCFFNRNRSLRSLHVFVRRFLGFDVRLLAFRDPMRILVLRGDSVRYRGLKRDRNILLALRGRLRRAYLRIYELLALGVLGIKPGPGSGCFPIFQFVLDDIETRGGNAVLGEFPGLSPLLFTQIPQGGTEFFARTSGQLLQIENRKSRRLTCRLAIEETKHSQPAKLLASDTVKKFPPSQAKPRRVFSALPESVILRAPGLVGKSVVGLPDPQKSLRVACAGIVRVKTACERVVYALDRLFICLRPNSQDLVVIGNGDVSLTRPGGLDVQRERVVDPETGSTCAGSSSSAGKS